MVSVFFFFKQKTAYEMRISDWSSDVYSSDLGTLELRDGAEHVKGEHATRRCRVDALGQRHQPDLLALQILGRGDQLLERAGEAVELPNNQRVACAQHVFQNARQFGPVIARARRLFRSEEHTFELQALMRISYAVVCLQKKTNKNKTIRNDKINYYQIHKYNYRLKYC